MRVLLDTNVLLWWMTGSERLTPSWRALISDRANLVYVSAISAVEIGLKVTIGKLPPTPEPIATAITTTGLLELPFTLAHGQAVTDLPWRHKDPFDRMIIAQAQVEGLPVATSDHVFQKYGLRLV